LLLGFKTELKVNNQQRTLLAKHVGTARHAWNWALDLTKAILNHNKTCYSEEKIKFPTAIELHKWLNRLVKPNNLWYYESSKCAPQYALRQLRDAWDRCFRKIAGAPKFKKKGRHDSFTLDGSIKVEHFKIKVPVIGWLRTYERFPQNYQPSSITISRQADRWFISFKLEVEPLNTPLATDYVGVDLGVLNLATLSTGEVVEGAKSYRKYEKKLSRLQWLNRHKVIGSRNWKQARGQIARLHKRIANIRQDTLHKLTTFLAKNHGKIVIENLNVSGMLANRKLAKAIQDMGFYEFRRQLDYKCKLYGSELIVADRWFASSKTCSCCGQVKGALPLSVRIFECVCGLKIDRDINAALNLAALAVSSTVSACGLVEADFSRMKQENNTNSI
jgi:putative transposase